MPWTKIAIEKESINPYLDVVENKRGFTYRAAIREALFQALRFDDRVFLMGEGIDDPGGVFGTTLGIQNELGHERILDLPLAENGFTGIAIGAAMAGMKPVLIHMRMDFLLLSMDQIVNHAAKWRYMFGGEATVSLTIRCIIGRGWGSAAQHSQSIQALFAHVPGLKVVMPSNPYDVKGLLLSSIADPNPVIFIEHRWLYDHKDYVPEEMYLIPIGKATVKREGRDVTIVASSYMMAEALQVADELDEKGVSAEVVDIRTVKPLDEDTILKSIKKTGRLVIADTGWKFCGIAAEIAAIVAEKGFSSLKAPIRRICLPDVPTPASYALEKVFYQNSQNIINCIEEIMEY